MAWDSSRPVNYRRLLKEWAIYAAIMMAIALVLLRGRNPAGLIAGVVLSLPLYVGFSAAMAKLGYQRKTLSEMRTPRAGRRPPARRRPARRRPPPRRAQVKPTKRTNASTRRR